MLSDAIQTNWSVNLLEQNLHSSTPSFKLDWPFRCLVISCMFTCQSFKEAHKILLCGLVRKRGGGSATWFFDKNRSKNNMFLSLFSVVIFVAAPKKGRDPLIHSFFLANTKIWYASVGVRYRYPICGSNSQTSISLQADSSQLFTYLFIKYYDISIFDIFLHADSQILVCSFHSHFVAAAPFRQGGSSSSVGKRKRNLNLTYQGHILDPCDNLFLKFDKIISFKFSCGNSILTTNHKCKSS